MTVDLTTNTKKIVAEDKNRLLEIDITVARNSIGSIISGLQEDKVVLVKGAEPEDADHLIFQVAGHFGLQDSLAAKAAYAAIQGHRNRIGKYFMSVNARDHYQFIPPHSEGGYASDVQLAAFYCFENTTDGGESILLNVKDAGSAWNLLKYVKLKMKLTNKTLSADEINAAKVMLDISIPEDLLAESDLILGPCDIDAEVSGIEIFEVLENIKTHFSKILQRTVRVYWDNVASTDRDSASEYHQLLKTCNLLREPDGGLGVEELDNAADRRIWSSGVRFIDLFSCKLTRKLLPGEMVILNNLTWTHSTANWTPSTGARKIAASFA